MNLVLCLCTIAVIVLATRVQVVAHMPPPSGWTYIEAEGIGRSAEVLAPLEQAVQAERAGKPLAVGTMMSAHVIDIEGTTTEALDRLCTMTVGGIESEFRKAGVGPLKVESSPAELPSSLPGCSVGGRDVVLEGPVVSLLLRVFVVTRVDTGDRVAVLLRAPIEQRQTCEAAFNYAIANLTIQRK